MIAASIPLHSIYSLFYEGADRAAQEAGYVLEQFIMPPAEAEERTRQTLARALDARNIRGLVFWLHPGDMAMLPIDPSRFALVALGLAQREGLVDFVCTDMRHVARLCIVNLLRLGYRRLGLALNGMRPEHAESSALAEMLSWQFNHGGDGPGASPDGATSVRPLVGRGAWGPEVFLDWYRREKPDAIISSDQLAIGWLREAGIRVPGDHRGGVAFAHLDIDPGWKGIAGVNQRHTQVGAVAMNLLISLLNENRYGLPATPRTIKLQGEWLDGDTAPAKGAGGRGDWHRLASTGFDGFRFKST
ncbi:MAG: LacI family transcriptional regulator [Opitutaceae bacterium]|jgi:LacI family transcriptional regulator|nr:LacI family transcriptional regulator [Opitutaceae bacterium]